MMLSITFMNGNLKQNKKAYMYMRYEFKFHKDKQS